MSNTFTISSIAPEIYANMQVLTGEPTAFTSSVMINSSGVERAALGEKVKSFKTPVPTSVGTSITPAMTPPDADDHEITTPELTISQTAVRRIPLIGETVKNLQNSWGNGQVQSNVLAQNIRAIRNEIEAYIAATAYKGASRAVGTAGVTPFASTTGVVTDLYKVLQDNGVNMDAGNISLVMNSSARANMAKLGVLTKVNESGTSDLLRRGVLGDLEGMMMKVSAGIRLHTKGTGTGYLIDAIDAIGATDLAVTDGSGTVLAGDIISLAAQDGGTGEENHKYVVNSALSGGEFSIGDPGLRFASVNDEAVTIGANYTPSIGFAREAIELAMRAPAMPEGGDLASEMMIFQDTFSGLVFELALYKGYKMNMLEIACHYGAKVWNSDHVGLILG